MDDYSSIQNAHYDETNEKLYGTIDGKKVEGVHVGRNEIYKLIALGVPVAIENEKHSVMDNISLQRSTKKYVAIGLTAAIIAAVAIATSRFGKISLSQKAKTETSQTVDKNSTSNIVAYYDEIEYGKKTFDKLEDYFIKNNRIFSDGIVDMLAHVVPEDELKDATYKGDIKAFEDLLKGHGDTDNRVVQELEAGNLQGTRDALVDITLNNMGIKFSEQEKTSDYGKGIIEGIKYYSSGMLPGDTKSKLQVFIKMLTATISGEELKAAAINNDIPQLIKLLYNAGDINGELIPALDAFAGGAEDTNKVTDILVNMLGNYMTNPNYQQEWIFPVEDRPYLRETDKFDDVICNDFLVLFDGLDESTLNEEYGSLRGKVMEIEETLYKEHGPFSLEEEIKCRIRENPERADIYLKWLEQDAMEKNNNDDSMRTIK